MNDLVNVAVELMLLGMGTVFVFLVVLIYATKLMSYLVLSAKFEEKKEKAVLASPVVVAASSPAQDKRLIEVINQAIKQHRSR